MKQIELTQGYFALVDDEDYEFLVQYKWRIRKPSNCNACYARTSIWNKKLKKYATFDMHRLILNFPKKQIDHIDRNGLNNTKSNLRLCTHKENKRNSRPIKRKKKYSSYKGISFHKNNNRWIAGIRVNGRQKHLGYFDTALEAAKAYDKAAKRYFKEFADINFKD